MIAPRLPLPNPEDWTDRVGAARMLSVSVRTVERMADDGRLKAYQIGACRLFWQPEVARLADARRVAGICADE
jgi:excisionase family DNA binding protein